MNDSTPEHSALMGSIVSNQANHSGLIVVIHPLALLNITDHCTRVQAQSTSSLDQYKVIGILLGTQSGRKVTINNSFEVKAQVNAGTTESGPEVELDVAYLKSKQEHLRQVFPNFDAIGWYSIGSYPTELELNLQHQYIQPHIESPLYLQFHAGAFLRGESDVRLSLRNRTDLPLAIYEPFYDVERTLFIEAPDYSVETEPTQRMALSAMVQAKGATVSAMDEGDLPDLKDSETSDQLNRMRSNVTMLLSRVQTLSSYIDAVEKGQLEADQSIMREIASLANKLAKERDSKEKNCLPNILYREYTDVHLGSYLASLTQGANHLVDLIGNAEASYELLKRSQNSSHNSGGRHQHGSSGLNRARMRR